MRLDDVEESSNIEDDRGMVTPGGIAVGGGGGALIIYLLVMLLGGNSQQAGMVANTVNQHSSAVQSRPMPGSGRDDADRQFISKVLKETEDVWTQIFQSMGKTYVKPKLVMFTDRINTGCGPADSGMGPFYCPADSKVYIDPSFYNIMRDQLHAGGEFPKAYVIAHEVGHHVQHLLGTTDKVDSLRQRESQVEANQMSVRLELQADFYAGVWASHAKELQIDQNDVQLAVNAANQIGDDTLQRTSGRRVNPSAFTHGTSAQRMKWFTRGYQTGDLNQGDTFNTDDL